MSDKHTSREAMEAAERWFHADGSAQGCFSEAQRKDLLATIIDAAAQKIADAKYAGLVEALEHIEENRQAAHKRERMSAFAVAAWDGAGDIAMKALRAIKGE